VKKILLVTTNFWPEPTGTSPYSTDLAVTLSECGYEVKVLTGVPHYPWWAVPESYMSNIDSWTSIEGIEIIRASHYIPKRLNLLTRIFFELSLIKNIYRKYSRVNLNEYDLVIAVGSSMAGNLVGKKIATKARIPLGIVVHDLAGNGVSQSGLPGGRLIQRIVRNLEYVLFKSALGIVTVSQGMSDAIIEMGITKSKVNTIVIYSANQIKPIGKIESRLRFGWSPDDFLVLHTGNMGSKQHLENVISASEQLSHNSKIKFFLVGHGNQEANLKMLCLNHGNIDVLPAVSDEDYSALLSAADLLLVNERTTQIDMSLPSKLTSYLYSDRPVIAAVPRGGATWKFLTGVAELVEAGNPIALARAIEELSEQPEKLVDLAKRGKSFANANLDTKIGRKKYLDWVEHLLASKVQSNTHS